LSEDESILFRRARPPEEVSAYGADSGQIMEVRSGAGAAERPLVIIIHGGFWRADIDRVHVRPMADAIAAAGWTTLLPEYARVPGDPEPTLRDLTQLLAAAPQCVTAHNGRIVLAGHSAGGHLALWASAARICRALAGTLALAPVADLLLAHELGLGNGAVVRFLGCEPVSRPDLDPRQMPGSGTPTTLVHGVEDATVPLIVGESYAAAHPQARWVPVTGAGHYAVIDPLASAWQTVMAELAALAA
jgi:acetyl esterase/lipase